MRRLFSEFERQEVFIERGQPLEGFMPVLQADNAGEKSPVVECSLRSVDYMRQELEGRFFHAHWKEVGQDKNWEPDADYPYYYSLERQGMLMIVVLTVDGEPAGYFNMVIGPALHYRGKRIASSDMFYICPQHRARYAVRLFRAAEAFAKAAGAGKMYIAFKIYKDITPLTKRLGFHHVEDVVVKTLE
jgi:GNAT superfamily N-acetyltransferase